jgi:predicted glycosyltransferase
MISQNANKSARTRVVPGGGQRCSKASLAGPSAPARAPRKTIWIDLDNTPHVPFFRPIIRELRARGFEVIVTARDAFQVCDLARRLGVACTQVGRHHGRNRLMKVLGLFYRAFQLYGAIRTRRPMLAVSHGSRAQFILSNILGIPSVLIADYEYARFPPLMHPTWRILPDVIPDAAVEGDKRRILKYPGIKEDVYVHDFRPDSAILDELGVRGAALLAVVRPPATEAHYHNPESELLLDAVMQKLHAAPGVRIVLLPRNNRQSDDLQAKWPHFFTHHKTVIPKSAIEGLNLLWHADLVVSGGGTMNREAAALGVPVYSIFRGKMGAVDRHLAETGRLVLLQSLGDVATKIKVECRKLAEGVPLTTLTTLNRLTEQIVALTH